MPCEHGINMDKQCSSEVKKKEVKQNKSTLPETNIAMEYPIFNRNTSPKGPFSIAMLVYRSVNKLSLVDKPRFKTKPMISCTNAQMPWKKVITSNG